MKKAQYICFEGVEGVGKSTQTQLLVDYLKSQEYKVLQTKEPGTPLEPLTLILRGIMLDNQYDQVLTRSAREFISQAIRSIHLERVIAPALNEYDYIIQDRGILSGYAYGVACGNNFDDIKGMARQIADAAQNTNLFNPLSIESIYDCVVYLQGDSYKCLQKALSAKQEFETGDAMESRGNDFMTKVASNMDTYSSTFNTVRIDVGDKTINEVHNEILSSLNLI